MRITLALLAIVAFAFSSGCLVAQGKITVDPNAGKASAKDDAVPSADPRLLQKITYSSGSKRLSSVLEDLGQLSGVSVYCGQNKQDWQVRDIPVVVFVRDMPLGRVLRAIADATHTCLVSDKVDDDSTKHYRIYRKRKKLVGLDLLFQSKHDAMLEAVRWQVQALIAYGKGKELTNVPGLHRNTWLVASLIASLGSNAEQDLFNGETLVFRGNDPRYRSTIAELYQWERDRRHSEEMDKAPKATAEDMEAAVLKIKMRDTGPSGAAYLETNLCPIMYGSTVVEAGSQLQEARLLGQADPDLPAYPDIAIPSIRDDMEDPSLTPILSGGDDAVWDYEFMRSKIDIVAPKEVESPTFADVITCTAAAARCNIITEDFSSHQSPDYQDAQGLSLVFGKDTTVTSALCALCPEKRMGHTAYMWFANEDDRLIVGWVCNWRDHHRDLLPAKYLDYLRGKLNNAGIGFDDALHCISLTKDSYDEWILRSRDLSELTGARGGDEPMWKLYDSLTPEDKALAKSDGGLSLAKFDLAWIASFFREHKLRQALSGDLPPPSSANITDADAQADNTRRETDLRMRAMSDPRAISTMVMRLVKGPASVRWVPGGGYLPVSPKLKLSRYDIYLDYSTDGEDRTILIAGPALAFPVLKLQSPDGLGKAHSR